jgi:prepilin-type processing-associated H-X9-DG protein
MSPVLGKTPLDYSWRNDATGESMGASDTELMGDGLNLEGLGCQQPGAYSHDGWYNRLYFDGHVRAEACR